MGRGPKTGPRAALNPPDKQVRIGTDPESYNKQTPVWQVRMIDHGSDWSFRAVDSFTWWNKVLPRLDELTDDLFSLRLEGDMRIWGIRLGRVLQLVWYDPRHEVYPLDDRDRAH